MTKIQTKEFAVDMQLKAIELLSHSLHLPPNATAPITHFSFNINIESKADANNKLVFVVVNVEIKGEGQTAVLGTISVSCIFEIANFQELIQVGVDGKITIPQALVETLNSLAISTTRGVMFSTFKGTFLHGAVLPIVDPKQF